ncbi:MAG: TldD/PmbA family protein [bacterium]|nr:TldD/PmbA family protein [bacterium]
MTGDFRPERVLEKALARCQAAEVFHRRSVRTPVEFENNRLKQVRTAYSDGLALRVIAAGRVGFSTTTKPGDEEGLVDRALSAAAGGGEARFSFPGPSRLAVDADRFHHAEVAELGLAAMIETGRDFLQRTVAVEPAALAGARLEKEVREVRIVNSSGLDLTYRRTGFMAGFGIELIEGENLLNVWEFRASSDYPAAEIAELQENALEQFRLGRKNVALTTGRYPVILAPHAGRDLLGPFRDCLNGQAVERGISPWGNRLGETLFDPAVHLEDNPLLAGGPLSAPFDDEGWPAQPSPLVRAGMLEGFYLDLKSAAGLGRTSTGNGTRPGLESIPSPSLSNVLMAPGQDSYLDLIGGIKLGLFVVHLMGAWAGNLLAGEVNGNVVLGYRIEDGAIVGRVKDCMLSVNAFDALNRGLRGLSRETGWSMNYRLPYIALDDVAISTKA